MASTEPRNAVEVAVSRGRGLDEACVVAGCQPSLSASAAAAKSYSVRGPMHYENIQYTFSTAANLEAKENNPSGSVYDETSAVIFIWKKGVNCYCPRGSRRLAGRRSRRGVRGVSPRIGGPGAHPPELRHNIRSFRCFYPSKMHGSRIFLGILDSSPALDSNFP